MSYVAFADFRSATLAEYCAGISLGTAEASDANITAAITRLSQRLDDYTNDHFESETLTLTLTGEDSYRLELPRRATAVSSVTIYDSSGTGTVQTTGVYRLRSSLYAAGTKRLDDVDYLELVYAAGGLTGYPQSHYNPYSWPCDANSIAVAGTFGWSTTPGDIKRALALMVWDHFKEMRGDLRRASRWTTSDLAVEQGDSTPTGIPECDAIISDFTRNPGPQVAIG